MLIKEFEILLNHPKEILKDLTPHVIAHLRVYDQAEVEAVAQGTTYTPTTFHTMSDLAKAVGFSRVHVFKKFVKTNKVMPSFVMEDGGMGKPTAIWNGPDFQAAVATIKTYQATDKDKGGRPADPTVHNLLEKQHGRWAVIGSHNMLGYPRTFKYKFDAARLAKAIAYNEPDYPAGQVVIATVEGKRRTGKLEHDIRLNVDLSGLMLQTEGVHKGHYARFDPKTITPLLND